MNEDNIKIENDDKELLAIYYKGIGEKIKKAREDAGYTLGKIAKQIGLTSSAIANYESGIRQIPIHTLLELARLLGKPMQYFLGPDIETPLLLTQSLKSVVERFSDATYIEVLYGIKDGLVQDIEGPKSIIPVPPEISREGHFAIQQFSEETGTYNYFICKRYKPDLRKEGLPFFKKTSEKFIPPKPDDWVLADKDFDPKGYLEKKGPLVKRELVQFKNVTPSPEWKGKAHTINVEAVVIARIERLVK